jgi:histidine ammonia-lyase
VQDPYSFRCIPQVHGASKDALEYGQKKVFKTEINSVTDNPNIFIDSDEIISGGNFHRQLGFSLRFRGYCFS